MIIEKTMSDGWLSNTWLVGDKPGGHAVLIDTGGPTGPILEAIEENRLTLSHVLCTHHHVDHVTHNDLYKERFGCPICGSRSESDLFGDLDHTLDDGDELVTGGLHIRALLTPGHTKGMLAFLVNEERVFTGDTLFRHTVGGTLAPGHATFQDLKHSIMDVLLELPREMIVHPGHTDPTTIGEELENNPFVQIWRGKESPATKPCVAMGRPAELVLRAEDYDGGTKCWVRFEGDQDEIAPGSQVVDQD